MKKLLILFMATVVLLITGIPVWVVIRSMDKGELAGEDGTQPQVRVLDAKSGRVMKLPVEEYLVGVVAAEMPAVFETEALKAQAIAARTYVVKRMYSFGAKPVDRHPDAEICTDPTHCQAWESSEELKSKWGKLKYYVYINKIKEAVRDTRGVVITYNNKLIDPVYHSSCAGKGTENSEDVWTNMVPYLRSVDCYSEHKQTKFVYQKKFSIQNLAAKLRDLLSVTVVVPSQQRNMIEIINISPKGRLQEASLLGQKITGAQLRTILGLSSTLLEWDIDGDNIMFTSTGKGHAVGMCQYGANGMALQGKSHEEIIYHYYTGVKLKKIEY
ncbi:stage II sporulation protein D [Phosphitispora sp. TUW77]|uniref:stage II sporulation protein D n=1 Tax=Phosphitispora sp. TUW77 TaxID=3152361 RepID=UPI003AB709A0